MILLNVKNKKIQSHSRVIKDGYLVYTLFLIHTYLYLYILVTPELLTSCLFSLDYLNPDSFHVWLVTSPQSRTFNSLTRDQDGCLNLNSDESQKDSFEFRKTKMK